MTFEWDTRKAALNLRKHEISFDEASTAFGDLRSITIPDPYHSIEEGWSLSCTRRRPIEFA